MSKLSVPFSRRRLLQQSARAAAGLAGTMASLHTRNAAAAAAGKQLAPAASPYGPIAPVDDRSTGLPLLQLPQGFSYQSHGWTGDPMSDGRPTPGSHDGMAVVQSSCRHGRGSELVLVRNHERGLVATPAETVMARARYATTPVHGIITLMYGNVPVRIGAGGATVLDPLAADPPPFEGYPGGGTSSLVFRQGLWAGSRASLGGTLGNCAGGPTPWGTWLSCEETLFDFSGIGGRRHGYVFESGADPHDSSARPIVEMGRIVHEAVAVDPRSGCVYETEDNRNLSALFRYVPRRARRFFGRHDGPGCLHGGGTLQAARIKRVVRQARPATLAQANDTGLLDPDIGDEYELEWVDVPDPDAAPQVVAGQPGGVALGIIAGPTFQALGRGCARMSRGEGIWHADGRMFIVDTAAGTDAAGRPGRGEGALWELTLSTMRLRAVFVSGDPAAANNPDNVTVSPRGGVVLCEDGGASVDGFGTGARLLGLSDAGEAYIFCKNNLQLSAGDVAAAGKTVPAGDYRGFEFAGACFDPDGQVLFANIQTPGISFAITGPWRSGNL
jgi:secreted PhoX family phosphatase